MRIPNIGLRRHCAGGNRGRSGADGNIALGKQPLLGNFWTDILEDRDLYVQASSIWPLLT